MKFKSPGVHSGMLVLLQTKIRFAAAILIGLPDRQSISAVFMDRIWRVGAHGSVLLNALVIIFIFSIFLSPFVSNPHHFVEANKLVAYYLKCISINTDIQASTSSSILNSIFSLSLECLKMSK